MRQLLGSEPLQGILGAICQKEQLQQEEKHHNDNAYYIQMIDRMYPVAALQQEEGKEKIEENTTGEAATQQRAKKIMAAIQQRAKKIIAAIQQRNQQDSQQPRLTTTYKDNNENNDDICREGE